MWVNDDKIILLKLWNVSDFIVFVLRWEIGEAKTKQTKSNKAYCDSSTSLDTWTVVVGWSFVCCAPQQMSQTWCVNPREKVLKLCLGAYRSPCGSGWSRLFLRSQACRSDTVRFSDGTRMWTSRYMWHHSSPRVSTMGCDRRGVLAQLYKPENFVKLL